MKALGTAVDVVCMGIVCVLRHLKENLAWATDKQLRNNNIVMPLRNYVE